MPTINFRDQVKQLRFEVAAPATQMEAVDVSAEDVTINPGGFLRANTAGTVVCKPTNSSSDVTVTLAAGEILPVAVSVVRTLGTSASLHVMV